MVRHLVGSPPKRVNFIFTYRFKDNVALMKTLEKIQFRVL